jgi:UDP-3-O-[3-hydroxymyristoyl] N-acetylglucosamine deacetylase
MMRRLAVRAAARRAASTLAGHMEVSGIGLHTGASVRVVARPAEASEGVYFVRTDLGGEPRITASLNSVTDTRLSTTLGDGDGANAASVRTVEHLLAALCGAGVSACRVEIDGPELPLLDGSAAPWVAAIFAAGVAPLAPAGGAAPLAARLKTPCWVHEGDAWVVALPADAARCASTLSRTLPLALTRTRA